MLKGFGKIRRWEEADDVLQKALIKLWKALKKRPPESAEHFYNLANLQIRRVLLDLVDHYHGPHGAGTNHRSDPDGEVIGRKAASAGGPATLSDRSDLLQAAKRLPPEERKVFDLLWHHGLTQRQIAKQLGVSVRTVRRRWEAVRRALHDACHGEAPNV
jgi:RNA polymerase sigma-70 factor (ECF subfamily)